MKEYLFADNINSLKPSAIREILKSSSEPGMIPLSAGNPAVEAFPAEEISEISADILKNDSVLALQYSVTEGYAPLREQLCVRLREKDSILNSEDDLIITAGAQQVMNLAAKVLANTGDTVLCEDPSFIGSLNTFRSYGLNLVGIPIEKDGIDIAALETALKRGKNVRFLYVIPNFQNPSGVTMSLNKRKAVYELAKRYNILILEDNPYGEIRFFGENIPSIKSFDEDGRVIYAGSFSKVLAPALRLGYAVANSRIIAKMTVAKQTDDVHTSMWSQLIADRFLRNYDYEAHLKKIRAIYQKKANLCMQLVDRYLCPKNITYFPVEGGLFLWCKLSNGTNMLEFCKKALEQKVAVVPGNAFSVDTTAGSDRFRINYSTPTDEQIEQGIERLGNIL